MPNGETTASAKRANNTLLWVVILIIAILVGAVVVYLLVTGGPGKPRAAAEVYGEDFIDDTYKDPATTTADWNLAEGDLQLPPEAAGYELVQPDGVTQGAQNITEILAGTGDRHSFTTSLVVDENGNPIMAFLNKDKYPSLGKWDGSKWVGFIDVNKPDIIDTTVSREIAVSYDYINNKPHIAWVTGASMYGSISCPGQEVRYAEYDSTAGDYVDKNGSSGSDDVLFEVGLTFKCAYYLQLKTRGDGVPTILAGKRDSGAGVNHIMITSRIGGVWSDVEGSPSTYTNLKDVIDLSADHNQISTAGNLAYGLNDELFAGLHHQVKGIEVGRYTAATGWTSANGTDFSDLVALDITNYYAVERFSMAVGSDDKLVLATETNAPVFSNPVMSIK